MADRRLSDAEISALANYALDALSGVHPFDALTIAVNILGRVIGVVTVDYANAIEIADAARKDLAELLETNRDNIDRTHDEMPGRPA